MKLTVFLFMLGFNTWADSLPQTDWGTPVEVGRGFARGFVTYENGNLKEVGIGLSPDALNGLPMGDMEFTVELPFASEDNPVKYIGLNWRPMGHAPWHQYGTPHFDIHYYFRPKSSRDTITCDGPDEPICMKQPPPDNIPPNYRPTLKGFKTTGWLWFDSSSPEYKGERFTSTMYYGFYDGQVIFVEPMVTRDLIISHKNFAAPIPQPKDYPFKGLFPTHYSVDYEDDIKMHRITLKDFISTN